MARFARVFGIIIPGSAALVALLTQEGYVCSASRTAGSCPRFDPDLVRSEFAEAFKVANHRLLERSRAVLTRRFEARVRSGRSPTVLYIGPNDLSDDELENVAWYARWLPRMVLVEPNPVVLPLLQGHLRALGLNTSRARVVNAAVCPSDEGSVDFHVLKGNPAKGSVMGSLSKAQLLHYYQTEDNLEGIPVRCVTPSSLLEELQVAPGDIDVLAMDAEGSDATIADLFLLLNDLSPAFIQFEWWTARCDALMKLDFKNVPPLWFFIAFQVVLPVASVLSPANAALIALNVLSGRRSLGSDPSSVSEKEHLLSAPMRVVNNLAARGYDVYQHGYNFLAIRASTT
mmetsp:Transcript_40353/g.128234  ORF Transcript_40353/g.128234 Transcript_40353/m.128234 type:complete len:344 (+) Transcript_40353:173-1204(+)